MPVFFLTLLATALLCCLWLRNIVKPGWTIRRKLPHPHQPFWLWRLFHEPDGLALERFTKEVEHNGLIRYFGILNEERIFAVSPETTREVLTSGAYNFIRPQVQGVLVENVSAKGLTFREGDEHKHFRKCLQPAFKPARSNEAYPIAWERAEGAAENMVANVTDGKVQILRDLQAMTLETMGKWAFSTDFGSLHQPQSRFSRLYTGLGRATTYGTQALTLGTIVGPRLLMSLPLRATRTMAYVKTHVRRTLDAIVSDREMEFKKESQQKGRRHDMIDTLLASEGLSHKDVVDESVHFLAAAAEMPTVLIAWTVHLLSRYPQAQQCLRKEVQDHFAASRSANELDQLPYLSAVVDETLRMHHPDTVLWRQVIHPTHLADMPMHPGVTTVWSPFVMNRSEQFWGPDASVFRPERWLEKEDKDESKRFSGAFSYINYGMGPRRCIGELYGKAVTKCMVAAIVRRLEVSPVDNVCSTDDGTEIATCPPVAFFKILDGWDLQAKVIQ